MLVAFDEGRDTTVTLLDDASYLEFRDAWHARMMLVPYKEDPASMMALRHALADDVAPVFVSYLNDDQVIDAIAMRLVNACVGVVRQRGLEPVYGVPEEGAAPGPDDAPPPQALGEEAAKEQEDTPPDPEVPPEYPRLAISVGGQLEAETRLFNAEIDALRHPGLPPNDESDVAPSLSDLARMSGDVMVNASESLGAALELLARKYVTLDVTTQIGPTFDAVAAAQKLALLDAAIDLTDALRAMARVELPSAGDPKIGQVYADLAAQQGAALRKAADALGWSLVDLARPALDLDRDRSDVAGTLRNDAIERGQQMLAMTEVFGAQLTQIVPAEGEALAQTPDDESGVAKSFVDTAKAQSQGVIDATDGLGRVIGTAVVSDRIEPPPPSALAEAIEALSDGQRAVLEEAPATVGRRLDRLEAEDED